MASTQNAVIFFVQKQFLQVVTPKKRDVVQPGGQEQLGNVGGHEQLPPSLEHSFGQSHKLRTELAGTEIGKKKQQMNEI